MNISHSRIATICEPKFEYEVWSPQADLICGKVLMLPGLTGLNNPSYRPSYEQHAVKFAKIGFETAVFAASGQIGRNGQYSYANTVEDAEAVLRTWLGSGEVVYLFGKSSGCPIALRVATRNSSQVAGVFLWGDSPKRIYDKHIGPDSDGSYMRSLKERGTNLAPDFYETLFYSEDELRQIPTPVWIAVGNEDEYGLPNEQLKWLAFAPIVKAFCVVPRFPHLLNETSPAWSTYWGLIETWLQQ